LPENFDPNLPWNGTMICLVTGAKLVYDENQNRVYEGFVDEAELEMARQRGGFYVEQ